MNNVTLTGVGGPNSRCLAALLFICVSVVCLCLCCLSVSLLFICVYVVYQCLCCLSVSLVFVCVSDVYLCFCWLSASILFQLFVFFMSTSSTCASFILRCIYYCSYSSLSCHWLVLGHYALIQWSGYDNMVSLKRALRPLVIQSVCLEEASMHLSLLSLNISLPDMSVSTRCVPSPFENAS